MIATTLHQIEITSHCNLQCPYCLHPVMTRPKAHMTTHTWLQCLRWLQSFVEAGTQTELNLNGTGEPTLHPRLPQMALEARAVLGPRRRMLLTTNGVAVTPALVEALKPAQPTVYVSLHRPEQAEQAVYLFGQAGMLEQCVMDPIAGPNSWAGQVAWPDRINVGGAGRPVCPWLSRGWLFVASDGTCYSCCYANGDSPVIGHMDEPCHGVTPAPFRLCEACWQRPPHYNETSPALRR
jgi:hypothetical protein